MERWFAERGYSPGQEPEAFARWLGEQTGEAIIGGPEGESPEFVALPDSQSDAA